MKTGVYLLFRNKKVVYIGQIEPEKMMLPSYIPDSLIQF